MRDQSTDIQGKERMTLQQCLPKLQGQAGWALSNLAYWKVSLPMAQMLELNDLKDPFQPKPFYLIEVLEQLANQRLGNSYSPVLKSLKRQVNSSNILK